MDAQTLIAPTRRPRFRRASEPPAFRLTDDDVHIVRQLARHRFLKSTHIAALVGRSLDRTNDRLLRFFHAGYIDRPRAQLDYYPTAGSSPIAYALADRGARLLNARERSAYAHVARRQRPHGSADLDWRGACSGFRKMPSVAIIYAARVATARVEKGGTK